MYLRVTARENVQYILYALSEKYCCDGKVSAGSRGTGVWICIYWIYTVCPLALDFKNMIKLMKFADVNFFISFTRVDH